MLADPSVVNPQARFHILDEPLAAPGKCMLCGISYGNGERKFIDTGVDLDWYGVVYYCTSCILEVSNQLGYSSFEQVQSMCKDYNSVIGMNQELAKENESLRSAIVALGQHTCFSPVLHSSNLSVPEEREVSEGTTSEREGGQEDIDEHDRVKGLPNVRGTSESDILKSIGLGSD